jgi:hypothetical protein
MLDLSHIPSQQQNTTIFYAQSGSWQTWNKPRNAKFIEIFCLGGGAGGAITSVGAGSVNGGLGGGSGGIVRGLVPAFLLPDIIYILVGKGGAGSTGNNTNGQGGGISYIGLQPSISEQTLICKSSTLAASGNGTGATISTVSLSAFGNLGLFTAIAGVNGSAGGTSAPTNGSSQAALGTNLTTGGAGGGGKTAAAFAGGGNITSASVILTSQVNGGVTNAQDGDSGYGTLQPFCGTGGAGGAGRQGATGAGGRGGNGWYGCGGGGAGGGQTATGTKAGDGGDGLVIITVIT